MGYESFRSEFILQLQESGLETMTNSVVSILDSLAERYEVTAKETQLALVNGLPEIVKVYIASRSVENLSKSTLSMYFTTLRAFFDTVRKPVTGVTTNDIRVYLYGYKERRGVKDSTLETIRVVLHSFFEWLTEEGHIDKNPVRRVAAIKFRYEERTPLTDIELARIRANCRTLRQKAIVDFLYSTGCRVNEVCNMKLSDVDIHNKEVRILHGKGDKFRVSYLNADSVVSLNAYLDSRQDNCPYLFVTTRKASSMGKRAIEEEIKKVAQAAGITKSVTPHTFRHTAATTALRRGMKIEEVQKFLGHSQIKTTLIYAKLENDATKASHAKYVS